MGKNDEISIFKDFTTQKWSNWIEIFEKLLDSIIRRIYIFNSQEPTIVTPIAFD